MNFNNNTAPLATLSLDQVDAHARNIETIIRDRKVPTLTIPQLITTVHNYLDDPSLTGSDIMRVRVRTASYCDDLLTNI